MRLTLLSMLIFMLARSAAAQTQTNYYAFAGAGTSSTTFGRSTALFHLGGGAEFIAPAGFGSGAELGYLGPWSNGSNGVGLLSANGLYRFRGRVEPFVTGGYSLGFRSQTAHFGNIGGGFHYWKTKTGIRFEVRDHIRDGSTHWIIFRVGLAFR